MERPERHMVLVSGGASQYPVPSGQDRGKLDADR
jgi:hypothetical protein